MKIMKFEDAIENVIAQSMAKDKNIIIFGEDVHGIRPNLFTRFGKERVKSTPISEGAFVGAAVTASMAGLRPIVEVMLVDFIGVAFDAVMNHAAKVKTFSGGKWNAPLVIRTTCGGGYGDAGQHEQCLWGLLAHIPGLSIVVPSNPADAGGLMLAAIEANDPVIFLEHKLLSFYWLDLLGSGGRKNLKYNIPKLGAEGEVPEKWTPTHLGKLRIEQEGKDISLVSLGVGVHRCIEASKILEKQGISCEILDLRSVSPLDNQGLISSVSKTGAVIVVDEDYMQFGLSGEISAILLEAGINFKYGRVCTESTIPYRIDKEEETLPNVERIIDKATYLLKK